MSVYSQAPSQTNLIRDNIPTTGSTSFVPIDVGELDGADQVNRALVKFDLSSIPSNATVSSAVLNLRVQQDTTIHSRTIRAFRVKRNYVDGQVCWNNFANSNAWQTAGATGANDIYAESGNGTQPDVLAVGDVVSIILSNADIEAWISGSVANYGLLIKVDTEIDDKVRYYYDGADQSTLDITYTVTSAPTVTTQAVSDIEKTTATGNGNVTDDGGATITERGTVYSTSANPTTSDTKDTASGTTGAFTTSIDSLTKGTLYHVRAYAINSVGTSYGSDVTFTTKNDVSITKGLIYDIKSLVAITKSLKYTIKTNVSAITKQLKYEVIKATSITKGLIYDIVQTPSAITKGLIYEIKSVASITKSLTYEVVITPTAIQKGLGYEVIIENSITKSLGYEVVSQPNIQKSLQYEVTSQQAINKSLKYTVSSSPSAIEKTLEYIVAQIISIQKSLQYEVVANLTINKSLKYVVTVTPSAVTKGLTYSVSITNAITKSVEYQIVAQGQITKALRYEIEAPIKIEKTLRYVTRTSKQLTKSLKYVVPIQTTLTKSLTYVIRKYPYCKKDSPYSKKTSPYSRLANNTC
ncbi:MAG: DNRLRE domain-containing protein [Minisyncoccia bacterium]